MRAYRCEKNNFNKGFLWLKQYKRNSLTLFTWEICKFKAEKDD